MVFNVQVRECGEGRKDIKKMNYRTESRGYCGGDVAPKISACLMLLLGLN